MSRSERLERLHRTHVCKHVDGLLTILSPHDAIEWGGLNYVPSIEFLIERLQQEVKEVKEVNEQSSK